jgi:hypothetical protein
MGLLARTPVAKNLAVGLQKCGSSQPSDSKNQAVWVPSASRRSAPAFGQSSAKSNALSERHRYNASAPSSVTHRPNTTPHGHTTVSR